jgi:hypothetical protein
MGHSKRYTESHAADTADGMFPDNGMVQFMMIESNRN